MSEEDVLAGRAIVILEVDDPKLLSESALKSHFRREYKNTAAEFIKRIHFDTKNTNANRNRGSNDPDEVRNLAVVLFQDPAAVLFLLKERLKPRSNFQLNGIELRRGTLQLGRQSILVEGCLRTGDNNNATPQKSPRHQPQQQQRPVSPPRGHSGMTKQEDASQSRSSRSFDNKPQANQHTSYNNNSSNNNHNNVSNKTEERRDPARPQPSPKHESADGNRSGEDELELEDPTEVRRHVPLPRSAVTAAAAAAAAPAPGRPKTKILFFIFTLLFCRPPTQRPTSRPQDANKVESRKLKDFDLTPFLVYQLLCDQARLYAIEVLPKVDANARHDTTKVLVEVDATAADAVIRKFDQAFVDFMSPPSPLDAMNGPVGGDGPETLGQRAEMRYRVYAMFSRDQHPIVDKPGQRNSFRSMRLTDDVLQAFNSPERRETAQFLLQPFSRRWCEDLGQPVPQHMQQDQQRFLQYTTVGKVGVAHGGQGPQKRGRSASPPGQAHESSSLATTARPTQAARFEPPQQQLQQQQQQNTFIAPSGNSNPLGPMHTAYPQVTNNWAQGGTGMAVQAQQRQSPPVNSYMAEAVPAVQARMPAVASNVTVAPNAYLQPPQQQQPQPVAAPVTPSPAPMPPLFSDHQGPLPPYWRPVFSEEYKQVYYVYQHPSGEERTTWTRPTA